MVNLKKIGIIGSTTIDKIVTGARSRLKLGGVTTYSGITYCRHDIPALVVSSLADQDLTAIKRLEAEGVSVFRGTSERTTHFVNYTKDRRRYQELPHTACPITADQIQAINDRVCGLHLGPLHPLDIDPAALSWLQESNLPIFLDVQGYTRMIERDRVRPVISDHLSAALESARCIKADGDEHRSILEFYQMDLSALMKTFHIEESVITLGAKGGFVQTLRGETFDYTAAEIQSLDDPTGAGDVFFAAYIAGRFSNQMPISDSCSHAAKIAARQVEGKYITQTHIGLD